MAERPTKPADRLLQLADEHFSLHAAADGKPYAVAKNGPKSRRLFSRTGGFRQALKKAYLDAVGELPPSAAVSDVLGVLAEKAAAADLDPAEQIVANNAPELLEEEQGPRPSAATQIVNLALEGYDLGCTPEGEPFAVPKIGPRIVRVLRGGRQSLRAELATRFFEKVGSAAPQAALADACAVLEGTAQQLEPEELHLRVAQVGGNLVLDLGDTTGRAVVITPRGWSVVDEPPVMFKRTALSGPLPTPARGGTLDALWPLLNVRPEYRPILAAVLVASLVDNIPHPVVSLAGEQGVGKSSATKLIAAVLDPTTPQLRKAPRSADHWVTAAAGSWVVALDNLSGISDEISDALCRASTGDGDVRRRLYSDADLHVISFRRCVIINGIDLGAIKDDLADRLVTVALDRIGDSSRKLDAALAADWAAAHPQVLAAVLDLAAATLQVLPSVQLAEMPRMADYARILAAVDQVLGTDGLKTYLGLRTELAEDALNSDPVLAAIAAAIHEAWTGTASDLLLVITQVAAKGDEKWRPPKGWPSKPRELTTVLKRRAPSLRRLGWIVEQGAKDSVTRAVTWRLTPPPVSKKDDPSERDAADDTRVARIARSANEPAGQVSDWGSSETRANPSEPERTSLDARRSLECRSGARGSPDQRKQHVVERFERPERRRQAISRRPGTFSPRLPALHRVRRAASATPRRHHLRPLRPHRCENRMTQDPGRRSLGRVPTRHQPKHQGDPMTDTLIPTPGAFA